MKKTKKGKRTRRRWPRLGSLIAGGFLAAVAGFIVLLVVYGAMGGGGHDEFVPEITETRSESHGEEPFEGGPRLHFPVDSIDMGQVPLNTNVGYAFVMTNTGDTAAHIEDASVSVLEGCWPFEPVIGAMTLEPGEESEISFKTHMMEGMDGPHLFEISVQSDDAVEPVQKLYVKAFFGP